MKKILIIVLITMFPIIPLKVYASTYSSTYNFKGSITSKTLYVKKNKYMKVRTKPSKFPPQKWKIILEFQHKEYGIWVTFARSWNYSHVSDTSKSKKATSTQYHRVRMSSEVLPNDWTYRGNVDFVYGYN